MSNRADFLKNAVFYAQQNPSALADYLHANIEDTLDNVVISGAAVIENNDLNGVTTPAYTAVAYNAYGDVRSESITLALKASVSGVSISGGVVTLTTAVADATTFVIKATVGGVIYGELPVTVAVRATDHVLFTAGNAELQNVAVSGVSSDSYHASAYDAKGAVVLTPITFTIKAEVTGVSIASSTGAATITAAATADGDIDFTIVATTGGETAEFDVHVLAAS